MSSVEARTIPLTVISPIRPGWTPFARLVLEVLPRTPMGAGTELAELRFVQSARWALITGLPGATPTRPTRLRYDYLLFESNFNGSFDGYLEAFADVLTRKMRLIWNSSYGFPNLPRDATRPVFLRLGRPIPGQMFVDYVRSASLPAQHYYAAYPATTTEVLAGLAAQTAVTDLRRRALAGTAPEGFADAFTRTLIGLQARPGLAPQPLDADGDQRGGMHAFSALTPITTGRVESLRELLTALGPGPASPFARVPGLHFARWVIIDAVHHQPGQQRDGWRQAYLLTTTTSDGTAAPLADLYRYLGPERDLVWGHCDGYPAEATAEAFVGYLSRCRLRSNRFYTAYPMATLGAVRSGLDTHRRLVDFAQEFARDSPEQRLRAFRDAFCAPAAP